MYISFVKDHTRYIESLVGTSYISEKKCKYHLQQISFLQNERIAHLHVLMGIGLMMLISTVLLTISPSILTISLTALFLILFIPYIFHYYFLENTIQKWYLLYNEMCCKNDSRIPG